MKVMKFDEPEAWLTGSFATGRGARFEHPDSRVAFRGFGVVLQNLLCSSFCRDSKELESAPIHEI
jgi:hypothetical protein